MKKFTDIRLACVEDGLDNTGFRKIAAFIKSINPNTETILSIFSGRINLWQREK